MLISVSYTSIMVLDKKTGVYERAQETARK